MAHNPYSAPISEAFNNQTAGDFLFTGPKAVSPGNGWNWLAEAYGHFKKNPWSWVGVTVVYVIILIVMSLIPVVGEIATSLLTPLFTAGIVIGCRAQDTDEDFQVSHLFAGFSSGAINIIAVSVITSAASFAISYLVMGSSWMQIIQAANTGGDISISTTLVVKSIFVLIISVAISMAAYFAPALIVLDNKSIFEAMQLSFIGCLKNILTFIVFFLCAVILCFLAAIPLGLGLLVMLPVMFASSYTSYKDIYID